MLTRDEFENERRKAAAEMAADLPLQRKLQEAWLDADRYHFFRQTTWMGEPSLQFPQDLFTFQDIIFETRPEYIVEIGTAWGGSLLFYSTLMEVLGGKKVIGVDIYIPDDLKKRIGQHEKLAPRIEWVEGGSTDASTVSKISELLAGSRRTLIHLDSAHTHEHVLKELRLYQGHVGPGYYLVCGDTVVEDIPLQSHRPRPWGPGNSPRTALNEFLRENDRFQVDQDRSNKLIMSCNPGGYLKCVKE